MLENTASLKLIEQTFGKDYTLFQEEDPFNPGNVIEGAICRRATQFYGALIITRVRGQEVPPQLILGTPKIHYPFVSREDGTRVYNFPVARQVEVYEKLDGTNVVAYFYKDAAGFEKYLTYKPRLRPFLAAGRFGDFLGMWREVGLPYQEDIRKIMTKLDCNLSFELYGSRNTHLMLYPNALDIALLFGITNTGRIMTPWEITYRCNPNGIPQAHFFDLLHNDLPKGYEDYQNTREADLGMTAEGHYTGSEGTVWYLRGLDDKVIQFKCKPETIEAIHWANGGLSKNTIMATCWNVFENSDELTMEAVKQLLLEEFAEEKIDRVLEVIERCIACVKEEAEFRAEVMARYKATGKNILLQNKEVMRELAAFFPKKQMRKVHSLLCGADLEKRGG